MNQMNNYDVEGARPLLSFQGRPVISLDEGARIATVDDVLVEPATLRLHALLSTKSGFLRPEVNVVLASGVALWGQDVVLVNTGADLVKRDTLPDLDGYLSAFHHLPGRHVISQNGDRVADMRDLLITPRGEPVGFVVDHLRADLAGLLGERRGEHRLPMSLVQSSGRDVLILDLSRLNDLTPPAQPSPEELG